MYVSKNMKKVMDGIMDSAASEWRQINLKNTDAIHAYSENGLNIYLTNKQAEYILRKCRKMDAAEKAL